MQNKNRREDVRENFYEGKICSKERKDKRNQKQSNAFIKYVEINRYKEIAMNYADIKFPDIQDGEGIRVALYVSGCHFHCKECHNKDAWDFNYGKKFTNDTINEIIDILKKPYVQGLSLLGGEPLELLNQEGILPLLRKLRKEFPEKDVWCWTGYDFDKDILNKMYKENKITHELINYIDIIVDGQFEIENKLTNLIFRGSTNQRKIDVKESLKNGKTVILKFGDESRYENKKAKIMHFEEFKKLKEENDDENINAIPIFDLNQINNFEEENIEPIEIKENEQSVAAKGINDNYIGGNL